jgi:putative aldouronate transport system substrate-binding protein
MPTVTVNGKIMGLPKTSIVPLGMLWVRDDWRSKLKIEKPKTLEDFINLAIAFRDKDPDGNGKNDTVGLTGSLDIKNERGPWWIINSFHGYLGIWYKKDGKVVYGSIQPEVRKALEYMAELYKKGVIDKNFATIDDSAVYDIIDAHQLGIYNGKQWSTTIHGGLREKAKDAWLQSYCIPSADDNPAFTQTKVPVSSIYVVSKDCKYPEAVVKMANFYMEKTWNLQSKEEMSYYVSEEFEGKYYSSRAASAVTPAVPLEHYKVGRECAGYWDGKLALNDTTIYTQSCIGYCLDPNQWYMDCLFGKQGSITRLVPDIMDNKRYVVDMYDNIPTKTMETKWSVLQDKEQEMLVRIVMGEDSIEAFDKFVEEWNALGGKEITDEINAKF